MATVREIELQAKGDEHGQLIPLEGMSEQVPFEVKRVYTIFDTTPGTVRGRHAHRTLRQVLVCVSGACTIVCELPDGTRSAHRLDWPTKGLYVEGLVWREMKDFSKDAVLMVLASEHYDPSDYIRDYGEFARNCTGGDAKDMTEKASQPLVSVLIPAFNHGRYVAEAVRSVIAQDWRRIELVVVDDGSSDDTWEVLESLRPECEARFERTVMARQENRGTCATLGRLFAEARGEFVGILASDDMYLPAAISALLEPLLADSGIGLAVGRNELMDDAGRTCYWDAQRNVTYDPEKARYRSLNEQMASEHGISGSHPGFGTYAELLRSNHIANGALIRKSVLDAIEPCSAETPLEDWWIMLQLAKVTRMVSVEAPTFRYRWHVTNTVKDAGRMLSYYYRNRMAEERLLVRKRDWARLDEYLGVYGIERRQRDFGLVFRRNRHVTLTAKIIVYEVLGFRFGFLHPKREFWKEGGER